MIIGSFLHWCWPLIMRTFASAAAAGGGIFSTNPARLFHLVGFVRNCVFCRCSMLLLSCLGGVRPRLVNTIYNRVCLLCCLRPMGFGGLRPPLNAPAKKTRYRILLFILLRPRATTVHELWWGVCDPGID